MLGYTDQPQAEEESANSLINETGSTWGYYG